MPEHDWRLTRVVVALYQEKGPRYRFRGEQHRGLFEIFYLDRGRAFVRAGARRFQAAPGECFLYLPGAFHQHQATRGHAPHYITIAFQARGAAAALKTLAGRPWVLSPRLRTLLARVVGEGPPALAGVPMRRALLTEFLVEWLRLAHAAFPEKERAAAGLETYHQNTARAAVARALQYVEEHLDRKVNLEKAARAAGVAPSYLRQLFRARMGHSLREECRWRRVQRAKHLLSHATGNVKATAAAVGYTNVAAFTRAFRAVEGLPPSAYARTVAARGPTPLPPGFRATPGKKPSKRRARHP